jgi:hypothetical protein
MNKKQIIALWSGIIIICLMGLHPPWKVEFSIVNNNYFESANYSWIFYPPSFDLQKYGSQVFSEIEKNQYRSDIVNNYSVHINITILFIQWICIALLTFGFILTFRDKKTGDSKKL